MRTEKMITIVKENKSAFNAIKTMDRILDSADRRAYIKYFYFKNARLYATNGKILAELFLDDDHAEGYYSAIIRKNEIVLVFQDHLQGTVYPDTDDFFNTEKNTFIDYLTLHKESIPSFYAAFQEKFSEVHSKNIYLNYNFLSFLILEIEYQVFCESPEHPVLFQNSEFSLVIMPIKPINEKPKKKGKK